MVPSATSKGLRNAMPIMETMSIIMPAKMIPPVAITCAGSSVPLPMALANTEDMPIEMPSVIDIKAAVTGKVKPRAASGMEPSELM